MLGEPLVGRVLHRLAHARGERRETRRAPHVALAARGRLGGLDAVLAEGAVDVELALGVDERPENVRVGRRLVQVDVDGDDPGAELAHPPERAAEGGLETALGGRLLRVADLDYRLEQAVARVVAVVAELLDAGRVLAPAGAGELPRVLGAQGRLVERVDGGAGPPGLLAARQPLALGHGLVPVQVERPAGTEPRTVPEVHRAVVVLRLVAALAAPGAALGVKRCLHGVLPRARPPSPPAPRRPPGARPRAPHGLGARGAARRHGTARRPGGTSGRRCVAAGGRSRRPEAPRWL